MISPVILLDVEGTTTPVNFVYGTLFPFAREHLPSFLMNNHDNSSVLTDLELLEVERTMERIEDAPSYSRGYDPVPYLLWLIDQDRKSPALKSLQGKIWQAGYNDGSLKGEVYDDVPECFSRWTSQGMRICIYSSGSVLAQKLLFKNSIAGDLSRFISGHFDTAVGPKGAAKSYETIAYELKITPSDMLFCSDVLAELDAASQAGCRVCLVERPGNKSVTQHYYKTIRSFAELT